MRIGVGFKNRQRKDRHDAKDSARKNPKPRTLYAVIGFTQPASGNQSIQQDALLLCCALEQMSSGKQYQQPASA